jgi:rubrerythrin
MVDLSRRKLLYLSAVAPLFFHFPALAAQRTTRKSKIIYPRTVAVLQNSFKTEMIAYRHYLGYTSKALLDRYPNIAYLFRAFSYSEKIHADNYKRILRSLGQRTKPLHIKINVRDTKSNLRQAARNELKKINTTYPDFIRELESEGYEEAIINCMYSWKSHEQHEETVEQIGRYSGMFFGSVSKKIEGLNPNYYICRICGSTIDEAPHSPCIICNRSQSNYQRIERPT